MADNYVTNPGVGGNTFASDEISTVHYARFKATWGPDGTANDTDVASGKPMPVQIRAADGTADPITAAISASALPLGIGAESTGGRVTLAYDGSLGFPAKSTKTRPADTTAYAVGDIVANSTTAGSVTPFSWTGATRAGGAGSGRITGLKVFFGGDAAIKVVRVHFYRVTPTSAAGDNAAFSISSYDIDNVIGYVDVLVDSVNGSGSEGYAQCQLDYVLASGDTVYALVEAMTAFTPGNAEVIGIAPKFQRFS